MISITHKTKQKAFIFVFYLFLLSSIFSQEIFWEYPATVTTSDSRFPSSATSTDPDNDVSFIVWQDVIQTGNQKGEIYLSGQIFLPNISGGNWVIRRRFAGPIPYSGEVPDIKSVAVNKDGKIAVAAVTSVNTVSVFTSTDNGNSFTQTQLTQDADPLLAPRIYALDNGSFILFASKGATEAFSLMSATSEDGINWTNFSVFEPSKKVSNAFVPILSSIGQNKDIVIFQASYTSGYRISYQLYSTISNDNGKTWSEPIMITTDEIMNSDSTQFTNYNNQRPNILYANNQIYLIWERTYYSSDNAQIHFAQLDRNGRITGKTLEISSGTGNASQPKLFLYKNKLSAIWFDTRRGVETVYFAQKDGVIWNDQAMTSGRLSAFFGLPIITNKQKDLNIFWQENQSDNTARIRRLSPDKNVNIPVFQPINYVANGKSTGEKIVTKINFPDDASGIEGYSWVWTQSTKEIPEKEFLASTGRDEITTIANNDGDWYLKVRLVDFAGNWSRPATVKYIRDTTPPAKPNIYIPETTDDGFLVANTFDISWEPSEKDDIAGYTYSLNYMGNINFLDDSKTGTPFTTATPKPPATLRTRDTTTSYNNYDNGVYAFSVAAIDSVGNIGEPQVVKLVLNKFIPYTAITSTDFKIDDFGTLALTILGRGFSTDGLINEVYIDRDGIAPYDRVLNRTDGDFVIESDRVISGITLQDLDEGSYKVGVSHSKRGNLITRNAVPIRDFGTVKLGDYSYKFAPQWQRIKDFSLYSIQVTDILLILLFLFVVTGIIISLRGIATTVKDTVIIRNEVQALITGETMPLQKEKKMKELNKKGISLRYKLIAFTSLLVIMVILLVSIPLGIIMTQTQEQTLSQGLKERVTVLVDSLSTSVKAYLPSQNILELSFLPDQISALTEAKQSTIIGLPANGNNTNLDYVWATNDPDISSKIDTENINYGSSRIKDDVIAQITEQCQKINSEATDTVEESARGIAELNAEAISLLSRSDSAATERIQEIQTLSQQMNDKLTVELNRLSQEGSGSYPTYNAEKLDYENTTYTFYKPVMYRQGTEQNFVRGIVLIEVSTENLIESVNESRRSLILTASGIAILAIVIGVLFSLILASIIVKPIRRLATHVAMIRDVDDKEELAGKDIVIKSKDEIGVLGETINDMTHGLVKAAVAAKDLTVGKEVQKMFIPLETDDQGKKLTTGKISDEKTEFFGYYEGAKGVSGDYFDYLKLDDRHYAIIKCDVSGKGVPAALIMVEVATLFLNYFKDWSFKKQGTNLSPIVSQINDLIESRGFKGRFAAFTMCIYDSVSGDVYFCNAGDNLIHIYDAQEKKKKTITLQETPASGVFATFMVDMKGGFPVQKMHLNKQDVLFLYTDGIEEAKRLYRNEKCVAVKYKPGTDQVIPEDIDDKDVLDGEEMEPERVNSIIEAVFSHSTFQLKKHKNPISFTEDTIEFDFTNLEGTAEDAIMALVSVEKVFRLYKDPNATSFDHVQVDRKIDKFLKEHFKQYDEYCSNQEDHPEFPEYMYYTYIKEDDQYDDLTLVAIKRQ